MSRASRRRSSVVAAIAATIPPLLELDGRLTPAAITRRLQQPARLVDEAIDALVGDGWVIVASGHLELTSKARGALDGWRRELAEPRSPRPPSPPVRLAPGEWP